MGYDEKQKVKTEVGTRRATREEEKELSRSRKSEGFLPNPLELAHVSFFYTRSTKILASCSAALPKSATFGSLSPVHLVSSVGKLDAL